VTSRAGLQEDDPLYAVILAQAELQTELFRQAKRVEEYTLSESKPSAKELFRDWSILIAIVLVIASIAFGSGYALCWINIHTDADARIDRMLARQPAALQAQLLLQQHGGSLTRESVIGANGKTEGIVLRHGDLPRPWVSSDGDAAVVPLQ
jgi:hypothetical protein